MKKMWFILIIAITVMLCSTTASATSDPDYNTDILSGTLILDTITIGDEKFTVPTIVHGMYDAMNTVPFAENGLVEQKQAITYFVPVTDEAKANNEYVTSLLASRETTDTFPFLDGYLVITTSIYYSYHASEDGSTPDFNVSIDAISIARNRDPDSSTLIGIEGNVDAEVYLGGAQENGGALQQTESYSLNWESYLDISSDFAPVVSYNYSDYFNCLVRFSFGIITPEGTETCTCDHYILK